MAVKTKSYRELLAMARDYGVEDNALFLSAAKNYELQKKVIDRISACIENDEAIVVKEDNKGRETLAAHPLIKELPKHVDSANKSLSTMLDIISKLGDRKSIGDKLSEFLNGK